MNSNEILFQFAHSVSLAGENVEGVCFLRIIDDIEHAHVQLTLVGVEYSKILNKRAIPFDSNNPQMIPEKLVEKEKPIEITLDSPKLKNGSVSDQKKIFEFRSGTMFQVVRQYGTSDNYTYSQDIYRGAVQAGCYKLPFSIPTKFSMSSSFNYKSKNSMMQAKVQYRIYLKISDLQTNKILVQKSSLMYLNSRYKESEQKRQCEGNIISFFCLHKGMIELQIRINKNIYRPGDQLEFEYILNSTRTQKAISKVTTKLNHFMSFTDNDEIERQIENRTLHSINLAGLPAGKRSETLKCSFQLPSDLPATVKTQFIKNHYILSVEAFADGLFTSLAVPVVCQIPVIILEQKTYEKLNMDDWKFKSQENNSFNNFTILQQKQIF